MDNENESTNESVLLDNKTSDLNLIVDKEGTLAYPMSEDGFCSMWAGCRANYGIFSGKVAFEVNVSFVFVEFIKIFRYLHINTAPFNNYLA